MGTEVDVVVVGGGIQGLLALDALHSAGYSTMLVSAGDLGDGQTIHSHGFLNTGFGMLGDALLRVSEELVQPSLRAHGVEPTGEWRLIPPPGFPHDAMPAALPAGFNETLAAAAVASPDRNFPKRRFVETMADGHRDRIVPGRATIGRRADNVRSVAVLMCGDRLMQINARVVIVAAGCGTKQLLHDLVGPTPQTAQIQHRRVQMICVRGPRRSLPATSVMAMPLALMLAAHEDGEHVTWYVTPMEFGGPSFDEVPDDAESVEDTAMLARGLQSLLQLYPALNDVDDVQIGSYAGYRQDVGDMPSEPLCEPVAGAEDVVVALPSGLVAAWPNTRRITELVAERAVPGGAQAPPSAAGSGVATARAIEDRPGFVWYSARAFARRIGLA